MFLWFQSSVRKTNRCFLDLRKLIVVIFWGVNEKKTGNGIKKNLQLFLIILTHLRIIFFIF